MAMLEILYTMLRVQNSFKQSKQGWFGEKKTGKMCSHSFLFEILDALKFKAVFIIKIIFQSSNYDNWTFQN